MGHFYFDAPGHVTTGGNNTFTPAMFYVPPVRSNGEVEGPPISTHQASRAHTVFPHSRRATTHRSGTPQQLLEDAHISHLTIDHVLIYFLLKVNESRSGAVALDETEASLHQDAIRRRIVRIRFTVQSL